MSELRGYLSPFYGQSFREFGDIVVLPESKIQLIRREISTGLYDYMGVYPFVIATNWEVVNAEIEGLQKRGDVSVTFVVDPISAPVAQIALADWDICRPFKTQFCIELSDDWVNKCPKRTRAAIRKSRQINRVELAKNSAEFAEPFFDIYKKSFGRLDMGHLQRLSLTAIEQQMRVPGCDVIVAYQDDTIAGIMMSYDYGDWANMHLIAVKPLSRSHSLSNYALIDKCISVLKSRGCRWANIGGPAGMHDDPNDGLYQFKKRWGGVPKKSILCGKILNPAHYEELLQFSGYQSTRFFPAYRVPGGPYDWNSILPSV